MHSLWIMILFVFLISFSHAQISATGCPIPGCTPDNQKAISSPCVPILPQKQWTVQMKGTDLYDCNSDDEKTVCFTSDGILEVNYKGEKTFSTESISFSEPLGSAVMLFSGGENRIISNASRLFIDVMGKITPGPDISDHHSSKKQKSAFRPGIADAYITTVIGQSLFAIWEISTGMCWASVYDDSRAYALPPTSLDRDVFLFSHNLTDNSGPYIHKWRITHQMAPRLVQISNISVPADVKPMGPPTAATINETDYLFFLTSNSLMIFNITEDALDLIKTIKFSHTSLLGVLVFEPDETFTFQKDSDIVTYDFSWKLLETVDISKYGDSSNGGFVSRSCSDNTRMTVLSAGDGVTCEVLGIADGKIAFAIPGSICGKQIQLMGFQDTELVINSGEALHAYG